MLDLTLLFQEQRIPEPVSTDLMRDSAINHHDLMNRCAVNFPKPPLFDEPLRSAAIAYAEAQERLDALRHSHSRIAGIIAASRNTLRQSRAAFDTLERIKSEMLPALDRQSAARDQAKAKDHAKSKQAQGDREE